MNILQQKGGRHVFAQLRYWEKSKWYFVSSFSLRIISVFLIEQKGFLCLSRKTRSTTDWYYGLAKLLRFSARLFCSLWCLLALREYKGGNLTRCLETPSWIYKKGLRVRISWLNSLITWVDVDPLRQRLHPYRYGTHSYYFVGLVKWNTDKSWLVHFIYLIQKSKVTFFSPTPSSVK